jgi:mxaJ protein
MYSPFLKPALVAMVLGVAVACSNVPSEQRVLRVCSDPNNLPFSNDQRQGFENRIAEVIARELRARVEYVWHAQRRGFIRNTLNAKLCDVVIGVPFRYDPVDTTRPYYRSTYVFVTRTEQQSGIVSFDDPALRTLKIGVHIVGDDYSNPPPVHALGRRNIVTNVVGYSIYGDYSKPNPPARVVEAVAAGDVDVAIVWGPFGGFFGARQPVPLRVTPVSVEADGPDLPFAFDIAVGVRKGEQTLRQELQDILDRRKVEIDGVVLSYGVPVKPNPSFSAGR